MSYDIVFADYDYSSGGIEVQLKVQCPHCHNNNKVALIAEYKESMLFSQLTLQCECGKLFSPQIEDKPAGDYFTEYMNQTSKRRASGAYGCVDNEVLDCFLETTQMSLPEKRSSRDSTGKRKKANAVNPWYQREGIAVA